MSAMAQRPKAQGLDFDWGLLLIVATLVGFGLMMVFSTTFDWAYRTTGSPATYFLRQLAWLGVGILAFGLFFFVDYRFWRRVAVPVIGLTLAALIAVLFVGESRFGATRGFFNGSVQPSEAAKLVIVLYLAVWLTSKSDQLRDFNYGLAPFAVIVGVIAGTIVLQPDYSAAITVALVGVTMFFMAGADFLQLLVATGLGGAGAWGVLQFSETAKQRIADFLSGLRDLTQTSWHNQQAIVAFVRGGWFGRGLGSSYQKFKALPTPHTDSIFAVVGEELGVLGCVFVIGLFALLVWRGFKIARDAPDGLGALIAAGTTCLIAFEALINIGVMVALLPFAGNALPFISYGGSSLVTMLAGIGLLTNISRHSSEQAAAPRSRRAYFGFGGRDRRARLSGARRRRRTAAF